MKVNSFPTYSNVTDYKIFLGGSTAKGDWQPKVAEALKDRNVTLINTSRPDWNDEKPSTEDVVDHIGWEMEALKAANAAFIYIPADAKSPTVLLELGLALSLKKDVFVAIEEGYSHYFNVREALEMFEPIAWDTNFDDVLQHLVDWTEEV